MPTPAPTTRRAHPLFARRVGRRRIGLLATLAMGGAALGVTVGTVDAAGPRISVVSPVSFAPRRAASVPLPAPAAVGQAATTNASVSTSTAGGLNGPASVDGAVSLMLDTSTVVTAVLADGSSARRTTVEGLNVVDAPAGVDAQLGFDTLVGATFEQMVDAVGSLTTSSLTGATTSNQQVLGQGVVDAMDSMVVGFPAAPVDVGATWTSPGHVGQATLSVPVTYQCRLTSVSGDAYTLDVSYSEAVDIDAPGGTMTGTISGSGSLTGSMTNPLVVSGSMYQTIDGVLTAPDATATPVRSDLSIQLASAPG